VATGVGIRTDKPFSLFKKDFPAGTIVLGGNAPAEIGKSSMYTVIVVPRETGEPGDEPQPPPPTQPAPQPGEMFNPPFPRIAYQAPRGSTRPSYSDGAMAEIFSKFDLLAFAGLGEYNSKLANEIKAINPSVAVIGTSRQGVWPGSDPGQCFVLRSGAARLLKPTAPGDTEIFIDSIDAIRKVSISQPDRYKYAVINNEDTISYEDCEKVENGYKLTGIPSDSGNANAVDSHQAGEKLKAPIRFCGLGMLHDLTAFAPRISDGREPWQYFIDRRFEITDFSNFDGICYDAYRASFYSEDLDSDIDLDRNDINDFEEHGIDWVNEQWKQGIIKTINYEKQRFAEINPEKRAIYVPNCGASDPGYLTEYVNGGHWEGFMRFAWNWRHMVESEQKWAEILASRGEPVVSCIEDYVKEKHQLDGKNDFPYMRYGLTTTLMGGGYYARTFGDWYYISLWYDEFETNLGYPRSSALKLESYSHQAEGQERFWVHVRFFDKGVVICNPTGVNQVVTDGDLRAFSEYYDGPYYRFLGGQDPDFNNGRLFDSVELQGEIGSREKWNRGDGIILLKQPYTVVSDILVGNYENNDTTPASRAVEYHGSWSQKVSRGDVEPQNPYYSQWNTKECPYDVCESYGYAVSGAGSGENHAIYRPTIGVPGYYEVHEWHGWHGDNQESYQEATNVPFEIHHGEGSTAGLINQQIQAGQWNSLGTYYFNRGSQGYVKISNDADGYVIADAFRFRYVGGASQ